MEIRLEQEKLLPFDRSMLSARDADIAAGNFASENYRYAKEFAGADVILIGAPYWDFSFPSMLKVYIEHICVNGITFGYENGKPVSFCRAKELVYVTTAGGYIANSLELYVRELCAMLGIQSVRFVKAEGLDIWGNDVSTILERAIAEL